MGYNVELIISGFTFIPSGINILATDEHSNVCCLCAADEVLLRMLRSRTPYKTYLLTLWCNVNNFILTGDEQQVHIG